MFIEENRYQVEKEKRIIKAEKLRKDKVDAANEYLEAKEKYENELKAYEEAIRENPMMEVHGK